METKIVTTKVKIPELVTHKVKIGSNSVIQIAQKEDVIEVDVYAYLKGCFLLKDKLGQEFYLLYLLHHQILLNS